MSALRRLAVILARHGAAILPEARADWGRAMVSELDHIDSDFDALSWALGCVWTGYRERSKAMSGPVIVVMRVMLAGVIGLYALAEFSVAMMAVNVKLGNYGAAAALDGAIAGDDYAQVVAPLEHVSPFLLAAWIALCALLFAAAVGLAFGWKRSAELFALAVLLQVVQIVYRRTQPELQDAFRGGMVSDVIVVCVFMAVGVAIAWLVHRPAPPARR